MTEAPEEQGERVVVEAPAAVAVDSVKAQAEDRALGYECAEDVEGAAGDVGPDHHQHPAQPHRRRHQR